MLTRLKVSGFKNLVDVDVRFGPFTCIAGANAVGKSNLFDAIRFLSALADSPLVEAAMSVRDGRSADIKSLFHQVGNERDETMRFEAEMIVPKERMDDLGQRTQSGATLLKYTLEIGLRERLGELQRNLGLVIRYEELVSIDQESPESQLWFAHTQEWLDSITTSSRGTVYISTESKDNETVVRLHHENGRSGQDESKDRTLWAFQLPRTVLSAVNSAEFSAVLLARREMQSWRLLHLEPSALREPDEFVAPARLGADGLHLPATLSRVAQSSVKYPSELGPDEEAVYAQIANRLADLVGFRNLWVDRDEKRELLTLMISELNGTEHTARALSEGTLRFLALATLVIDPETTDLLCLEQPEDGIAPQKIPALLRLLGDYAVDATLPVGLDNPLRQVIITTHSPNIVLQVPEESLLVAEVREAITEGKRYPRAVFSGLSHTWRQERATEPPSVRSINLGTVLEYLNPIEMPIRSLNGHLVNGNAEPSSTSGLRVIDRDDVQKYWPYKGEE